MACDIQCTSISEQLFLFLYKIAIVGSAMIPTELVHVFADIQVPQNWTVQIRSSIFKDKLSNAFAMFLWMSVLREKAISKWPVAFQGMVFSPSRAFKRCCSLR